MIRPLFSTFFALLLMTFGLIGMASAQALQPAKLHPWEIGLEPIRFDLSYRHWGYGRYMNILQPLPGFYVRRYFDRIGVRLGVQAGNHRNDGRGTLCDDCGTMQVSGRSLGLYAGYSYQISKKLSWLQCIADMSWQIYRGRGVYSNHAWGPDHMFSAYKVDEFILRVGLNPRFPITKRLSIGTELTIGKGFRMIRDRWRDLAEGTSGSYWTPQSTGFEPMGNIMIAVRL